MPAFAPKLRKTLISRRGTAALEYAVMGGGLVLLIAIAGELLGASLSDAYNRVACTITGDCGSATPPGGNPPPGGPGSGGKGG